MVQPQRIIEVMGGAATLGRSATSIAELDRAVADGLPKGALRCLVNRLYPERGEARRALYRVVPEATYKRRTRLSPEESSRTERLARITASAEYVWENREDAREWLMRPHAELGGRAPIEQGSTELGARQVEELLERLFYGIPA